MSSSWFLAAKHDDVVSLGRALQAQSFLLNSQDSLGYTALHHAAKEGSLEAIAMLIQGKADVNLQTKLGDSALIIAAQHNRKEVGEVLIMAGANLNIQNARGDSALMTAARYNSKDVVYPLISARANTNLRTTNGNNTALMIAAGWDYTDIVTALIIGGADLEIQNNEGKTAVKIAKATNFIRSAFLIECALAKRLKRPNDFITSSDIEPSPKKTAALVFPASRNWEVDFDELLLEDLIGNGGFGEVYKARLNGTPVAVKKVFSNFRGPQLGSDEFCREMELLADLHHPNICLFMAACLKEPNLAIVMEWLAHGSLWDALRSNNPPRASREEHPTPQTAWPWSIIERVTFGISCGMAFLHGKDPPILHQDLKSLNILIGEGYTAKVVDFGMTRLKSSRCLARGLGS